MNICVTGGAGFIGSHLVDRLIDEGHQVVVIDNLVTGCKEFVNKKAIFYEMDICSPQLIDIFKKHAFDYVFHEAAQTMVDVSMREPAYDCNVNLMGLLNILDGCRLTRVKKILMPSSAAVYGNKEELPLGEMEKGEPASFYGLTKLTTEAYLKLYYETFNLPYVCYRYANVYGPRQGNGGEGGVVSIFCKLITEEKPLHVFGDGEQTRDFIYVADVVDANLKGIEDESLTGLFNVSTNKGTSVKELISHLQSISGKEFFVTFNEPRLGDIRHSRLDNKKAKDLLKWEAKTPIDEGLRLTYNYFAKSE